MNIITIGDSYAAGVSSDPTEFNWLDLMTIPLNCRFGKPGSTAKWWESQINSSPINAAYCDMMIVSLLGNDAMKSTSDGNVSVNEILSGIENMSKIIEGFYRPWTGVFLYADPFFGKNKYTKKSIPLINRAISIACAKYPVHFIELNKILNKNCFDGKDIHPNHNGQVEISKYLKYLFGC